MIRRNFERMQDKDLECELFDLKNVPTKTRHRCPSEESFSRKMEDELK